MNRVLVVPWSMAPMKSDTQSSFHACLPVGNHLRVG
jgi:hypothetical protein